MRDGDMSWELAFTHGKGYYCITLNSGAEESHSIEMPYELVDNIGLQRSVKFIRETLVDRIGLIKIRASAAQYMREHLRREFDSYLDALRMQQEDHACCH